MKLVILGAGGYANTVRDVAEQLGYEIVAMLDDKLPGLELSIFNTYITPDTSFIPAFGNNTFRIQWCDRLTASNANLATLIHPTAYVSPKAVIAPGTVILPHAVVNTGTIIEKGCIINLSAVIDHGCIIEEGCHICLGAIVKGDNRIAKGSKIEAGEVVEARKYPV